MYVYIMYLCMIHTGTICSEHDMSRKYKPNSKKESSIQKLAGSDTENPDMVPKMDSSSLKLAATEFELT